MIPEPGGGLRRIREEYAVKNATMMYTMASALLAGPAEFSLAGSLTPSAPPSSSNSAMYSLQHLQNRLATGTNAARRAAAPPTAAPNATGVTLDDLMAMLPARDTNNGATRAQVPTDKTFWCLMKTNWGLQTGTGTRVLSPSSIVVSGGYYVATALTNVDPDLAAANIRTNVNLFGINGRLSTNPVSAIPTPLPKTWQLFTTYTGDDGYYHKGVGWTSARFTVGTGASSNCVTDRMTGLMWVKNPDAVKRDWFQAVDYCENLDGSSGRGGYTDWRLPNVRELHSLVDFENYSPALPDPHPFVGIIDFCYWTSTSVATDTHRAWWVEFRRGSSSYVDDKSVDYERSYTWPCRGGPN